MTFDILENIRLNAPMFQASIAYNLQRVWFSDAIRNNNQNQVEDF